MRPFLIKLSILTVALLVLQIMVSALYPPELPDEIGQLERHLHNGADLIYLGDSTVTYPAGEVTTAEILQEMLPDHRVGQVAHPAYNLDLYRYYAGYIARADPHPNIVIIPINLRSFSPEWDLRPAYQFEREKTILAYGPRLSRIFYRPLNTLGGFEPSIGQDEFLNAPVFNGETPVGRVADFEALLGNAAFDPPVNDVESAYYSNLPATDKQETQQARLTYYYMYKLTPTHRKIQSMVTAARLLKAAGIEPVFYITPVNYQLGRQFVGELFERRVTENVRLIAKALRAENIEVLNLVFELEAYHFIDTEHLTESGKARVAEALAAAIDPARPTYTQTTLLPTPTPTATRPRPVGDVSQVPTASVTASPTPLPTTAIPTASPPAPTPTSTRVVPLTVTPSAGQGRIKNVDFVGTFQPSGNYLIDLYRVSYRTLNYHGRPVDVRANIYVPQTAGETAFPVLVYGAGTTGIGPNCPPLEELRRQQMWGGYHYQMLEYAGQGFIVVWPNGQGFDDGQPAHPYFMAKLQGYTMLDAARAVYRFFDDPAAADLAAKPMAAVFFGGYSSGGHSAFAAKDLAAGYAPELSVKGIIGHGPTTNVETLLKENPIFSPYLVSAYRAFYGENNADPARIFQDRWLASFNADTMTKCVDDIFGYFSPNARQMYRTEFREALYSDRLQSVWPGFKQLLDENATGLSPAGAHIPVLILQGTADQVVTPPSQKQFALDLCRLGNKVTYLTYPAATHAQTRNLSFHDTLAWMHAVAKGERPESSCPDLIGQ